MAVLKKTFTFIIVSFLALFLLTGLNDRARAEDEASLTIDKAVQTALMNNKTLDNVKKNLKQAEIYYNQIKKERLPKLSTNYSYIRLNDDLTATLLGYTFTIAEKNNYSWVTSLSMPVFNITQNMLENIAKLGIDVEKLRLISAKNNLVFAVKYYYYNALKNKKLAEFFQQNLKSYQEHENNTLKFFTQGLVAKNSMLEAKVETSDAKQELLTAIENSEVGLSTLNITMGIDISQKITLEDSLGEKKFKLSLKECLEYAQKNNPELVAFKFLKQQAEKAVELEKAAYIPQLDISSHYYKYGDKLNLTGYEGYPNNILSSMLNLKWHVFDWGQLQDQAKIKEEQFKQIINNESLTWDNIALKIKEAYAQLKTAEENLKVSETAIAYAKENVRITSLRYAQQVAPSSEVIDAMTSLKKAEFNLCDSLYSYNIAIAKLENSIGADTEKAIKSNY